MAAYRRVYDSHHLQADCQELGSALEPNARLPLSSIPYLQQSGYCICSLQKKYHIRIDTGDTFHVRSKIHNADSDDDLMITLIAVLSSVFDKAW